MTEAPDQWLSRVPATGGADDAGAVLREWRLRNGQTQGCVAALLHTTQQHLSQMEKGVRPLSLDQRRTIVAELGIPPEDLGLSGGQVRHTVSSDGASPEISASRLQWRAQRRWLNKHRSELARLAVDLYPEEQRIPRAPLIAPPEWLPPAPVDLRSIRLSLDESEHRIAVDGSEAESASVRPLRLADTRFDSYTSAIKHLDPPQLFESRPSYRLLGAHPPRASSTSDSPRTSTSSTSPRRSGTRSPPCAWTTPPCSPRRVTSCAAGSRSGS